MIELATPEDRLAASGEYVLGTLGDGDRRDFVAALERDLDLQAEVYRWQDRLLSLSARADAAVPSADVWPRLDHAVRALAPTAAAASRAAASARPAAARSRWWRRTAPWQGIGGIAVAASLVLAALLVERTRPGADVSPRYLAILQSPQDRTTGWVVEIEAERVRLVPVASTAAPPPGRSLQFWTKPQDATSPTSLGLVRSGETTVLPVSRLPAVGEQQLFEITLEPENGSPIGRPTGPILYVGRTVHL